MAIQSLSFPPSQVTYIFVIYIEIQSFLDVTETTSIDLIWYHYICRQRQDFPARNSNASMQETIMEVKSQHMCHVATDELYFNLSFESDIFRDSWGDFHSLFGFFTILLSYAASQFYPDASQHFLGNFVLAFNALPWEILKWAACKQSVGLRTRSRTGWIAPHLWLVWECLKVSSALHNSHCLNWKCNWRMTHAFPHPTSAMSLWPSWFLKKPHLFCKKE